MPMALVSCAWLTVREDNKEAVDLYKKLGFVRTGRASSDYNGGVAGYE